MIESKYITRDVESVLKKALGESPVVAVTGPRQTGKSTLLKETLPDYSYITLDDPMARQQAIEDRSFLDSFPPKLIIDEFQYAPGLLSYIKMRVVKTALKKVCMY